MATMRGRENGYSVGSPGNGEPAGSRENDCPVRSRENSWYTGAVKTADCRRGLGLGVRRTDPNAE